MKTEPRRRRWLLPIGAVLFALALAELVLQAGSFVLWSRQRRPVPAATGNVVLCVGDSWTQGMGSADPLTGSYPARLQRQLHAAGHVGVSVVNGGQSGQNSRDVLERLPAQLADYRPKWLCVLVGQNDYWSRPDEFVGEPVVDHSTYRFRWRLPRLLAWAIGNLRGDGVAAPPPRDPAAWAPRAVPATPDPYANEPSDWPWSPELHEEKLAGWRAKDAKDWAGCRRLFESARQRSPGDPQVHQTLAQTYRELGLVDEARREMEWLQAAWQEKRSHRTGIALAWAQEDFGSWRANVDHTTAFLERFPADAWAWRLLANARFQLGDHDAALQAIDRSIALRFDPWAWFIRYKIFFVGKQDVPGALRAIYDCYAIDNDSARVISQLRAMAENLPELPDRALLAARAWPGDPAVRERLVAICGDVAASLRSGSPSAVLARHLERICTVARNAGAQPVLLSYPWRTEPEDVLAAVARDLDVPFVQVRERFEQLRGATPHDALRAPDGHCNDAGYELMTTAVAEVVGPLVGR